MVTPMPQGAHAKLQHTVQDCKYRTSKKMSLGPFSSNFCPKKLKYSPKQKSNNSGIQEQHTPLRSPKIYLLNT